MEDFFIYSIELKGKKTFTLSSDTFDVNAQFTVEITIDFDNPNLDKNIRAISCYWGGHPPRDAALVQHVDFALRLIAHEVYCQLFIGNKSKINWANYYGFEPLCEPDSGITIGKPTLPRRLSKEDFYIESVEEQK